MLGPVSGCPKGVKDDFLSPPVTQERNGTPLSAKEMLGKVACADLPRRVAQTHKSEP